MKLESINSDKFPTLSTNELLAIRGGSGAGGEQNGMPRWDDASGSYIIPVRLWSSDEFRDGVWCYGGLHESEIYAPKLFPGGWRYQD